MNVQAPPTGRAILAEARAGAIDILPPLIAAAPIGLVFGTVAATKGMTVGEVMLMSATVFAGGAQFAAIEIWTDPAPVAALAVSTLLINARHVLMGASLTTKLGMFSGGQKLAGLFWMADENWALAERRARSATLTPAYWFAGAVLFWLNWVAWSGLGAMLGAMLGDPNRFGADFVFTAMFIALVAAFWRGRVTVATVIASGVMSALVYRAGLAPWHVLAGALSGILAAYLTARSGRSR